MSTKLDISIVLPGIRPSHWQSTYESILKSTSRSFELIICSPFALPPKLQDIRNVKYAKDYGNPVRASNIAASLAEGRMITWIADDAVLFTEALDQNINLLIKKEAEYMNRVVVVAKYYEGKNGEYKTLQPDSYFKINGSDCTQSDFIENDWWIFNVGVMFRSFFEELGGWSSEFETTAMAHSDFAIRAYLHGAKVFMSPYPLLDCDHYPGLSFDHAPVHNAQIEHDQPLFQSIYRNSKALFARKFDLKIDNWKEADLVWKRRFNQP